MIQDTCKNCNVAPVANTIDVEGHIYQSSWCNVCIKKLWGKEGYIGKSDRFTTIPVQGYQSGDKIEFPTFLPNGVEGMKFKVTIENENSYVLQKQNEGD